MDTPLAAQGFYTLMLAASAGVVLYAGLVALRHLYPSLSLFYGRDKIQDVPPYGALLAVVALGFAFAAYVTPATVIVALVLLLLAGILQMKAVPPVIFSLSAFVLVSLALLADIDVLKRDGFTIEEMGLALGFLVVPVLASFAPAGGVANITALTLFALIALVATVLGPLLTQSFAHGTAAASIVFATVAVALVYGRAHAGTFGRGAVTSLSLLLAHSALVLGHSGAMLAGLAMMAAAAVATLIAASGRAVR